jgi:hypothetical protein
MLEAPDGYRLWHSVFYVAAPIPAFGISIGFFAASVPGGCGCESAAILTTTLILGVLPALVSVGVLPALLRADGFSAKTYCVMAIAPYLVTAGYTIAVNMLVYSPPPLFPLGPMYSARLPRPGILVFIGIAAGLTLLGFALTATTRRIPDVSKCKHCAYDLAGLESGVCPECGAACNAQ